MRNYYNNARPQHTKMSFLFICKCMIFYFKSRNVYHYFHFIFGKYSPKYLFEYWEGKANIIEYIETKWYIKLTKFGYYRVVKNIAYFTTGVDLDLIWGQYADMKDT